MLVTSDPTSSTVPTGTLDPVHFGIVLPAHDEEQLLPSALGALSRATGHVSDVPVVVGITIVLDACTDRSRDIVTAWQQQAGPIVPGPVDIVETDVGNVGRARRIGFERLLRGWSATKGKDIWLATTDADSEVPRNWISSQLAVRRAGGQVWAGSVSVGDWSGRAPGTAELWTEADEAELLPVHGANFGIEAALYVAAGGFAPLPTGEDRDLFERVVGLGAVIGHDPAAKVVTSSRRVARAPGGFAHALTSLETLLPSMTQGARRTASGAHGARPAIGQSDMTLLLESS